MKVLVYGYGLMGKKLVKQIVKDSYFKLEGIISPVFDEEINYPKYSNLKEYNEAVDLIVDFSHPNNLNDILEYALKNKTKLVIATTGFNNEQLEMIKNASKQIPIFQSFNTSFGIQNLVKILKTISKELYQNGYDIEILEKHHNQKIDAPSGTAKLLYDVINEEIPETKPVYDRSSIHSKREKKEVGIQAIRGGTIFGEHSIYFAGNDEIIEIKHTALSKEVFVNGALAAAKSLENKERGLFDLKTIY